MASEVKVHPAASGDPTFDGYYGTERIRLIELLGKRQPRAALEIGCGSGANLAALRARVAGCHTVGVEIHPIAAEAARCRLDEVIVGDVLDETAVHFAAGTFDVIVMSHVLEHFPEPERVLARALPWLAPAGCLLIALPNVRHLSVLLDLVWRGDFPYRDAGILDRTHLRFYTRRSARRFIEAQGLVIDCEQADIDGPRSRLLDRVTLGVARELAAFAFNFRASRQTSLGSRLESPSPF